MLPDRVSNPGPLTYESGALLIWINGPAPKKVACAAKTQIRWASACSNQGLVV